MTSKKIVWDDDFIFNNDVMHNAAKCVVDCSKINLCIKEKKKVIMEQTDSKNLKHRKISLKNFGLPLKLVRSYKGKYKRFVCWTNRVPKP